MSNPFVGIWGKLDRANYHLGKLAADIDTYVKGSSYRIAEEADPKTRNQLICLRVSQMPPVERWAIRVGEIVYQLRSALDHSIETLTVLNKGGPLPRTQFPIFTYRHREDSGGVTGGFEDRTKKGEPAPLSGRHMIRGVGDHVQEVVESMQPYHRRGDVPQHPLWVLNEISNIDKHRTLVIIVTAVADVTVTISPHLAQVSPTRWVGVSNLIVTSFVGRADFAPYAELARCGPDADMKLEGSIEVAFGKGEPAEDRNVLGVLADQLRCLVGIIRTFEGLTGQPAP